MTIFDLQAFVKHAVLPLGPLSLRLLFEIELQQLHTLMQIRDCLKPFLGSKNEFGRRLTLLFFVQALADALRMNQRIAVLDLCASKIGDDDLEAWW